MNFLTMIKNKKKLGKFGQMVKEYENARRPYGQAAIKYLKKLIKTKNPLILDLGCGTGISSRQLITIGKIIGCDPDPIMIKAAKRHKSPHPIKYVLGKAEKLPFNDSRFDAVTAFAAFHWFANKKALAEIKRVLKPKGVFFAVNKTGVKSWGEGYRKTIMRSIGGPMPEFGYQNFQPARSLKENGFINIKTRIWPYRETYTLANALEYVQSVSIWNSVPKNKRAKALVGLKKHFQALLKRTGKIERKLSLKVITGQSKK